MTRSGEASAHPLLAAIRREYDAAAASYDAYWAEYNRASLELLSPALTARLPGRVLDVGCGTGNLLAAMREWGVGPAAYVGVDPSFGMLGAAAEKELSSPGAFPVRFIAGQVPGLPLVPGLFDTAVAASTLHYWPDPLRSLGELRRLLAAHGRLLLVDWCADYRSMRLLRAWLRLTGRRFHRIYTSRECLSLLRQAGFRTRLIGKRKISPIWGLMVVEAVPERSLATG